MATKIGVYFDAQNIGGGINLDELALSVSKKWGDFTPIVKCYPELAKATKDIQDDINANGLDGVLICGTSPRNDTAIYAFEGVMVERVNLREQCVLAYKNPDGSALNEKELIAPTLLALMAQDYVHMGVVKLQKATAPEGAENKGIKRVLVVGGGWTGLTSAMQLSKAGYEVVLVEKQNKLGGHVQNIPNASPLEAPWTLPQSSGLDFKIASVEGDKNITVYTSATMGKLSGQPGEFVAQIHTASGEVTVEVGAAVLASGWTPLDAKKYLAPMGYGVLPKVYHAGEFGKLLREGLINPKRVAFILDTTLAEEAAKAAAEQVCTESNDAEPAPAPAAADAATDAAEGEGEKFVKEDLECIKHLTYSNSVSSIAALRLANTVCDKNEGAQVFILYKHMVVQGILERYYKHAQNRLGIMMTKADVTNIAQGQGEALTVSCQNTLLGMDFDIDVDAVVLPTGIVPTTAKEAVMQFDYRQGPDFPDLGLFNGFSDSNYICFPYETRRTGVYAAGCVRQPMTMDACEEDAYGAALKAIQCIEAADHGVAVHPRSGDLSYPIFNFVRCTQCKRCTEECPFGALDDDEKGTPKPNPARCRRCGTCFGACPERVISFANYNIDQIGSMIREVHVPKDFKADGPRILILACENDAYPALDMAAMRRKAWSPYARVIPVRCLGSINAIWVSDAMSKGFDGVMLLGCKYGDDYQCHFIKGSEICNRRKENIAETLNRLGVEPERVGQLEVAIDEYDKVPDLIDGFVSQIISMGPNPFKGM